MRVCPQGVFILFLSYQPTPTSISQISTIRIQFIPSSPTPCIAVFAKGMVYRHVGQSVARHLMEVVSAWRRELVHVRTAETNNINDSKHESYPTGSFYSVFVLTSNKHQPHQSNPYSIHSIITNTLHSGFYSVYRPVGQSVVRHLMVNVSDAHRESHSRKGIRDINHQILEA